MTITTLRPTSTSVNTFTLTGGASANAVTSDDLDTSYAQAVYPGFSEMIVGFSGFVLPAGTFIKQVRMRIRYQSVSPGAITLWYARLIDTAGNASSLDTYQTIQTTPQEGVGGWRTLTPGGNNWSAADVNALRVDVYPGLYTGNVQIPRIYEVYLDVETNSNPTTTITSPADGGSVTTTSRPPTVFTYADVDNDPIDAYRVMFFSKAQFGASGFDPNTATTAIFDSGKVQTQFLPANGVPPVVDLINLQTYRVYVWVYQFGATGGRTGIGVSTPAMSQFTMNVTPPGIPNLSISAPFSYRVEISATAGTGGAATAGIFLERSLDGGVTYSLMNKNMYAVPLTGGYDYIYAPNRPTYYRARAVTAGGISSDYCVPQTVTVADNEWRLRPVDNTSSGLVLNVIGNSMTENKPEDIAFFSPLGRSRKVAVADTVKGVESSLVLEFLAQSDYDAFEAYRNQQKVWVLVRGWTNDIWYIRFTDAHNTELFNYKPLYKVLTLGWIEADPVVPG